MIVEDIEKPQDLQERKGNIVRGWESISKEFHGHFIYSGCVKNYSNKKQFFRIVKKYGFPLYKENGHIHMFKEDIEIIKNSYLFGKESIAVYIGIHIRTLRKWLKRYPKMPVDQKRNIAFIPALNLWYATLIFDREKRDKTIRHFVRYGAPIVYGFGTVQRALDRLGFLHPKELKRYWLTPENDILKAL